MKQYYRLVLELYKGALMGDLKMEALKEAHSKLAKEITRVHIEGGSDTEFLQLIEDLNTLDLAMAE